MKNLIVIIFLLIAINIFPDNNESVYKIYQYKLKKDIQIKINDYTDNITSNVYRITEYNYFSQDRSYIGYYIGNAIIAMWLCIDGNSAFFLIYSPDDNYVKKNDLLLDINNNSVSFTENGIEIKYSILEN